MYGRERRRSTMLCLVFGVWSLVLFAEISESLVAMACWI